MNHDPLLLAEMAAMLLAVGALGGFLSGLLGIGGGTIFVPALFFAFELMDMTGPSIMKVCVGTSLVVVLATASTSARGHHKRGAVEFGILKSWGPFLILGVVAGGYFASKISGDALKAIFATVTLSIAAYMILGRNAIPAEGKSRVPAFLHRPLVAAIGCIASMAGMGGAIMTVPLMIFSGIPTQRAVGTAAAMGIFVALPGMLTYGVTGWFYDGTLPPFSLGFVNVLAAMLIIPASTLMAPVGVRASHAVSKKTLRMIFACHLIVVSIKMLTSISW